MVRKHMTATMKKSQEIVDRLRAAGASFHANDNIADYLEAGDLECLEVEVRDRIDEVLRALVIDVENDPNTEETARRMAKLFLREVFAGRYVPCPKATDFPNERGYDGLIVIGPLQVRSTCSHHFAPILGHCWIGVVPGERVIGISKYSRIADWVLSRPQIQEEAAVQLADRIEELTRPAGLAVHIDAVHSCMTWRGVKETESSMTTTVLRGVLRDDAEFRREFFARLTR